MKAKLFLSCGQNPQYRELDWGEKVASCFRHIGFDVFFAPRVQDSKSLTEVIFQELQNSDYYVFIDFKREKLVPPFGVDSFQHRGSLFSHQEFALACYLGLDIALFREAGTEPLAGMTGIVMGNAAEFKDRNDLVQIVENHLREKLRRNEWSLDTRNALQLVRSPTGPIQTRWKEGVDASYYHLRVKNLHWRKPATNCYAYLDKVTDLLKQQDIEIYTCELKWEGTLQSDVRIQPRGQRGLDAFTIVLSDPRELRLMPRTDAANYIQRFFGPTQLEITYVVCSDQFPDAKDTFHVIFDGHDVVQFN
jgi:hypothetical protein